MEHETVSHEFLTVAEVADRLRVSEPLVRRWARTGELPSIKLPGRGMFRFRTEDVDRMTQVTDTSAGAA